MKIVDKLNASKEAGQISYSFEFFPPKTAAGVENLYLRMDRMSELCPTFVDVTWGAVGRTRDLTLQVRRPRVVDRWPWGGGWREGGERSGGRRGGGSCIVYT